MRTLHGGVSSSWALLKEVSVEDICKAASWSSRHTFIRFYMLDVAEPSFLHSVLRAPGLRTMFMISVFIGVYMFVAHETLQGGFLQAPMTKVALLICSPPAAV